MKKIIFLSGREWLDRPQLVLTIFLSVILFSSALTGSLKHGNVLHITERHYHDNPQGFFTFFILMPEKDFREDTTECVNNTPEVKELSMDSTPINPAIQKYKNLVTW